MLGRAQLVPLFPENKISDTVHLSVFHTSFAERLRIYYRMLLVISHQGGYINKHYNSSANCSLELFVI